MKNRAIGIIVAAVFSFTGMFTACKTSPQTEDPDFLGNYPPQSLGVAHLNIVKRYSSTLIPRNISFVFDPKTNTVKFHHKLMGDNIWVYLSKENRQLLREGIERYLAAFKAKTLTQEGSKKKGCFGKTDVLVTWGLAGSAHQAYPTLRFDYQFITPQRPYFILANATVKGSDDANCPAMRIAISPAQCQDMLGIIDEQALSALIDELRSDYDKFDITENGGTVKDIEDNAQESDDPAKEEEIVFDTF